MTNSIVLSIFHDRDDSDAAVDELKDIGIDTNDISIVFKGNKVHPTIQESAGGGATTGGIIGGIAGLLVGIGAITIPGIGAVLVGGPLITAWGLTGAGAVAATTITGGVTGALAGGLVGALVGLGLSEEEARNYESHIKNKNILIAVNTDQSQENNIKLVLAKHNGTEIKTLTTDVGVAG